MNCESLEDINIPSGVTDIGACSFVNTPWLASQQKKDPLVIINSILIDGNACSGAVTIPENVRVIVGGAFNDDPGLTELTIPETVEKISYGAIDNCEKLKVIRLRADDPAIYRDYSKLKNCCESIKTALDMLKTKDYSVRLEREVKFPFLIMEYLHTHDAELEAFLKKNFSKLMKESITNGDLPMIKALTMTDAFVTKRNIDKFIQQAVSDAQPQAEAFLKEHKNRI